MRRENGTRGATCKRRHQRWFYHRLHCFWHKAHLLFNEKKITKRLSKMLCESAIVVILRDHYPLFVILPMTHWKFFSRSEIVRDERSRERKDYHLLQFQYIDCLCSAIFLCVSWICDVAFSDHHRNFAVLSWEFVFSGVCKCPLLWYFVDSTDHFHVAWSFNVSDNPPPCVQGKIPSILWATETCIPIWTPCGPTVTSTLGSNSGSVGVSKTVKWKRRKQASVVCWWLIRHAILFEVGFDDALTLDWSSQSVDMLPTAILQQKRHYLNYKSIVM